MNRIYSSLALFLFTIPSAYALQGPADAPPPETTASPFAVAIFLILFVGIIVGFAGMVWWNSRKGGSKEIGGSDDRAGRT